MKKILIFHFRMGRTDGVSLEIANWKEILEREGWEVLLCSGPVSEGADYVVDGLEMQLNPTIFNLDEEAFGGFKTTTEEEFVPKFRTIQDGLSKEFERIIKETKPDRVIVSNIFSVGLNWEDIRYRRPSGIAVERQLEKYFPPTGGWIKQACINSIARNELGKRKGVDATLVYDCIDFDVPNGDKDGACGGMLKAYGIDVERDLIVLQATRIVRRKNIELSMDVVKGLQARVEEL